MLMRLILKAVEKVSKTDVTDLSNQQMIHDVAKAAYEAVKIIILP